MKPIAKLMLAAILTAGITHTITAKPGASKAILIQQTEDRHLSGFSSVEVSGSMDVHIVQGSSESVKVKAPQKIRDRIITEVKGGVLKIYIKSDNWNWSFGGDDIEIFVTAKSLSAISLSGSGDIDFDGGLKSNSLSLRISGSGDISGKIDVTNLECSISGSGDMELSGRAQNSTVRVTGSGDFTGTHLATANTVVKVVGSGDARVNASQKVQASVTGSGDVMYTGGAKDVSASTSGSGDVSRF